MSDRVLISFSGGRTSAYMAKRLLLELPQETEKLVVFANTGEEDERTLQFVDRCDTEFNLNVVWVEAIVNPTRGKGTTHRVVDFKTATRSNAVGGPFEAMIQKYGIPNKPFPHCTRELKLRPITSYARSIGWSHGSYTTAIGIRGDELDRISSSAADVGIDYPLVKWRVRKNDVLDFWREQSFDLMLPEHFGNCVACWKKSKRKLLTVARQKPTSFDFVRRMERLYALAGPSKSKAPQVFFRENTSAEMLVYEAHTTDFELFEDSYHAFDPMLDVDGACGGSCEIDFGDTHVVQSSEFLPWLVAP